MRRVTTILSDIGNVILDFDEGPVQQALSVLTGRSVRRVREAVYGDGRDSTKPFRAFMRGHLDADEFRHRVAVALCCPCPGKQAFEDAYCGTLRPIQPVVAMWHALRLQGFTVTAVSNIDALRAGRIERAGMLLEFDHLALSCREGLLKPSAELMVRALDLSGAKAEETVFIDDKPKNFPPCESLGIRTHRYVDFVGLQDFLRTNGIIG